MRNKLTKAQKAHNRAEYNRIRRAWENTNKAITYKQFKKRVLNRAKGLGETIKEAAQKESYTRTFKTAAEIGKENLLKGLKKDFRNTYEELRSKVRRLKKGERLTDRLTWDANKESWILVTYKGERYLIDISNSPKAAVLIEL